MPTLTFQSTPPVKAATSCGVNGADACGISIHAAREGGDVTSKQLPFVKEISIHAAREGGDTHVYIRRMFVRISIHAAREGGDCGNE